MIYDSFRETCRRNATADALVDGEVRVSFEELSANVDALAATLAARWAPKAGDWVVLHLWNSREYVAAFFALMRLGTVAVLLNPRLKANELRNALVDLPIRGVVTSRELAAVWPEVCGENGPPTLAVDELPTADMDSRSALAALPPQSVSGGQAAIILCTSGTTGLPRRVVRSHHSLLANAGNVATNLDMAGGAKILSVIPFAHANGFSNCLLAPLLHGTTLCLMRRFDPVEVGKLVEREDIGFVLGSPFIFSQLLSVGRKAFARVKIALSSGAPLPAEIKHRCQQELGLEVRQLYGSSETGTIAIQSEQDGAVDGCLGQPLTGVELAILDAYDRPLLTGETGEIAVRSPAMMSGYWEKTGPSRAGFRNGFFGMGDLGCLDELGRLHLRGRTKRMINVGGVKLDPEEIAQVIRLLPDVVDCLVHGAPHAIQTELVAATIWLRPGAKLSRGELTQHCRSFLAENKLPRLVVMTDEARELPAMKALAVAKERP